MLNFEPFVLRHIIHFHFSSFMCSNSIIVIVTPQFALSLQLDIINPTLFSYFYSNSIFRKQHHKKIDIVQLEVFQPSFTCFIILSF